SARQIGLDADRGFQSALYGDAADASYFAQALRQQRVRKIRQLPERNGVRRQRQRYDRNVGRIDLGVNWRIGQVLRQGRARRVDGGLDVLGGAVDVAVEIKLQRNLADPE